MPSPNATTRCALFSPVPTQMTLGFFGSIAIAPVEKEPCPSKIGEKETPALVDFHTPPAAVATYQIFLFVGSTATSAIRPDVSAGPIDRSFRPARAAVSALLDVSAAGAGVAWAASDAERPTRRGMGRRRIYKEGGSGLTGASKMYEIAPDRDAMMIVGHTAGHIVVAVSLHRTRRAEHSTAMPAAQGQWTVDMLDALPEDGQRYEIIDGELYATPAPSDVHQLVAGEFYQRLSTYLRRSRVGRALISPADVRRGDRTRNRVQPDVFAVRVTEAGRPPYPYDLADLLLAIEVASPSNPLLDYQVKRELYLSNGVPEYWIVNTEARLVSRWRAVGDPGEEFSRRITWHPSGMTSPLVIDLPELFADALG